MFRPITVGTTTLKNRIQFSPIVSRHADPYTGTSTNDLVEFLGAQARSGAALVTIGSSPIDFDRARDFYGCLSVVRESDVAGLSVLAEEVHRYGAKLSIELTHAGAVSDPALLAGPAFAPSVIPGIHNPSTSKEIDRAEMDEVKQHWVDCVRRVKRAGFDMAMIHGAHMNLFASFLTPLLNRRTDDYGGSPENRMRFPLEVLKACREEAGPDFGLELRISGDERVPGGVTLEERIAFLNAATPYIDMVIVSTGGFLFPETAAYMMAGYHFPHMLNVETAAEIKKNVSLPVSVVGGITTIDEAEEILAAGKVDIVAMAKALIADQDLVTKARAGKAADIRPCLRCLECAYGGLIGTPLRCAVNPQAGREVKYREIPLARKKKRVLVIGGGPAGMTAARVACERGHEVTLWEKSERLGGRLYEAAALPQKDTARAYIDWAIRSTMKCGATLVLGKEATPAAIEAEAPDAVIVAVGAAFTRPQIDGIDLPHVMTVSEADLGTKPGGPECRGLRGRALRLGVRRRAGHGGQEGHRGGRPPEEALCQDAVDLVRVALFALAEGRRRRTGPGRGRRPSPRPALSSPSPDGGTVELPADTVVIAFGLRPDPAIVEPLLGVVDRKLRGGRLPERGQDLHSQSRRIQRGRGGMT